jgi:hypothetical protein
MTDSAEVIIGGIDEAVLTWEDQLDDIADLLKEAEEIAKRPDEFTPPTPRQKEMTRIFELEPEFHDPKKLAKIRPVIQIGKSVRTEIECVAGLAKATWAAVLLEVATRVAVDVLAEEEMTRRKRRRRKTWLCVRECLDIVQQAKRDVYDGYATHRALETEAATVKRYRRRYRSRA